MKKSLVAAMFAVMMISLVGCGKASEPKTIETTEVVEEVTETEEATEVEAQDAVVDDDVAEKPVVDEEPVAEEPASPYSYTDLSQTLYAQSTVNVRDLPEQTGAKLGSLSTNQEVTVIGQCNETGWYKISYNGGEGFVSNSYLGSEKVAVKSKSSSTTQSTSQAESQPAQEAPAETTDDNPYSGMTTDQLMDAVDAGQLTPDHFYCGICGFETDDAEAAHNHLREVHNMQV
mgnify:CR=1 FL=1